MDPSFALNPETQKCSSKETQKRPKVDPSLRPEQPDSAYSGIGTPQYSLSSSSPVLNILRPHSYAYLTTPKGGAEEEEGL
jgi:hypothetical protein